MHSFVLQYEHHSRTVYQVPHRAMIFEIQQTLDICQSMIKSPTCGRINTEIGITQLQPPLDSCQHVCVILTLRQAADLLRNGLL